MSSSMNIQDLNYETFLFPALSVLESLGGSASVDEIETEIIGKFGFTDSDVNATYITLGRGKSDVSFILDKIAWARTYLKLAGLAKQETRGVWIINAAGRAALNQGDESTRQIVKTEVREYNKAHRERKKASPQNVSIQELSVNEIEGEDWQEILLARLKTMPPADFERLSQRLLRECGFTKVEVKGKSGDGGIDGQGVLRVNLVSFTVLFQCKRYQGSVGSDTVRDFRGAMQGRADKGLIITTGTFTTSAKQEAIRDGAPSIDLIDGEDLVDLLKDRKLGVKIETVEKVTLDEAFFQQI
jgi:restriction system protein